MAEKEIISWSTMTMVDVRPVSPRAHRRRKESVRRFVWMEIGERGQMGQCFQSQERRLNALRMPKPRRSQEGRVGCPERLVTLELDDAANPVYFFSLIFSKKRLDIGS
jgi:hypothetical protein